ncbi:MAG: GGDEF domain-containing protein [Lachnospiraceae bacterium]|nr:GGDEF domain-containing protein [Lachnospiraceae bacterium]
MLNYGGKVSFMDDAFENSELTFSRLALSLARDYISIYYVNMENGHYHEYGTKGEGRELIILSEGDDFFSDTVINANNLVYKDDVGLFLSYINKDKFERLIKTGETFTINYRLLVNGSYRYYNLKSTKGESIDDKYIIIGVRDIDDEYRRSLEERTENEVFNHIVTTMASRYELIYYVDIETDDYIEYRVSDRCEELHIKKDNKNFFENTQHNLKLLTYSEDYAMVSAELQKDRLLSELEKDKNYSINYRLMYGEKPEYINLRVSMLEDGRHLIFGVINVDASMKREMDYRAALRMATVDSLTGVKNKRAYLLAEQDLNQAIKANLYIDFALVVCDINNLKEINDRFGHIAGDDYIRLACSYICDIFKHSPVFRIGGDEFVVILKGEDFTLRDSLLRDLSALNDSNKKCDSVVIATGIMNYRRGHHKSAADVFKEADKLMYENKQWLKGY